MSFSVITPRQAAGTIAANAVNAAAAPARSNGTLMVTGDRAFPCYMGKPGEAGPRPFTDVVNIAVKLDNGTSKTMQVWVTHDDKKRIDAIEARARAQGVNVQADRSASMPWAPSPRDGGGDRAISVSNGLLPGLLGDYRQFDASSYPTAAQPERVALPNGSVLYMSANAKQQYLAMQGDVDSFEDGRQGRGTSAGYKPPPAPAPRPTAVTTATPVASRPGDPNVGNTSVRLVDSSSTNGNNIVSALKAQTAGNVPDEIDASTVQTAVFRYPVRVGTSTLYLSAAGLAQFNAATSNAFQNLRWEQGPVDPPPR